MTALPRRLDRLLVVGCAAVFVALAVVAVRRDVVPDDLQVYKGAVDGWLSGGSLYDFARPNGDRFTYPPGAAVLLAWVHWLDGGWLAAAWVVFTAAALWGSATAVHRAEGAAVGPALALLLLSAAGRANLEFGQLSVVVFALCLVDCCLVPRHYRGLLTGVAAAVKLTPLAFLVLLLVRRRWGDLSRAGAAAALVTGLGGLLLPEATARFVRSGLWSVSTVSHWDSLGNQSIRGVLARLGVTQGVAATVLGALVMVAILAWGASRSRDEVSAWTAVGLAGILASPLSWTHHRFWLTVPLLLPWLWTGRAGRAQQVLLGIGTRLFTVPSPEWAWPLRSIGFTTCVLLLLVVTRRARAHPSGQWDDPAAGSTSSTRMPPASLGWMKLTRLLLVPRLGAS